MPLTPDEFDAAVKAICPHCRAGLKVRQRTDTKEWVHDNIPPKGGHGICWADGLRRGNFVVEQKAAKEAGKK